MAVGIRGVALSNVPAVLQARAFVRVLLVYLLSLALPLLPVRALAQAAGTTPPATAPGPQVKRTPQEGAPSRRATGGDTIELRKLLLGLESGTAVRTSNEAGSLIEGDLLHVGDTDILIGVAPLDDVAIEVDDIDTLWLITGRRGKTGARWGMLIGGITGAVFLARAAANNSSSGAGFGLLFGAAGGALSGGAVGLLIGSFVPVWEPAFQRE